MNDQLTDPIEAARRSYAEELISAKSVRGPSHVVTAAKTPVLARARIDSIEVPTNNPL